MKLLVIGDSITKGTYTSMDDYRPESIVKVTFADIIKDRLNFDTVLNLGMNGISFSSLSPVLSESALTNRINEFVDADMVILCAGTNDFGNNVPLGHEEDCEDISFFGAVDLVLKGIKKNNKKAKLYILTPIPRFDQSSNKINVSLEDYRNALILKGNKYGYKIIDGDKIPIDPNCINDRKIYMLDGVHVNGRGHRLIAEHILSTINNENNERLKCDEIYSLLEKANEGQKIVFPKNKIIDFWSDDCKRVYGYHFSNTASYEENPEGERPVALYLKNKKNIVIDGNGCKIILHGIFTPFLFDKCENITLKNLTFDYIRPTLNEFTIKKDGNSFLLEINKDSLFSIEQNKLFWKGELKLDGTPFWKYDYRDLKTISMFKDFKTEQTQMLDVDKSHTMPCVPEFELVEKQSSNEVRVVLKNNDSFFPDQCIVQTRLTRRDQIGGCFFECNNIKMKNIIIHAMHGLGILAQNCKNVSYRRINIIPSPHRTIASNADFFQYSGCSGQIEVKNCVLKEGHDDFINIHGTHLKIVNVEKDFIIVRFMNAYSRGFKAFDIDDKVEFISKDTLKPYGSGIIKNFTKLNDTDIRLQLLREHNAKINDCVENVTKTPKVRIVKNIFGPSMGRGVLCTTRKNIVIKKNIFYKNGGGVLVVEDDCNFWFESGYVNKLNFVKNSIFSCGYGYNRDVNVPVISVCPRVMVETEDCYVHNKIIIKNNNFYDMPKKSKRIDIKYTNILKFVRNKLDGNYTVDCYKLNKLKQKNRLYYD